VFLSTIDGYMEQTCQNCKAAFTHYPDDLVFYEQMKTPAPTFCVPCRAQRRFMWRNERALYHRSCDNCKKKLISLYREDAPFPVYCKECWYSDSWNPLSYGRAYDPNIPFFEQLKELMQRVPRLAIWVVNCVNSDYTNQSYNNKNSYLGYGFRDSEDCAYVARAVGLRNCFDCTYTHHSEGLYETVNVDKSYRSRYVEESEGVVDSLFVSNCRNVQNCLGVINSRGGSYIFMGEQLTKEEYQERISKLDLGDRNVIAELEKEFEALKAKAPYKYAKLTNTISSTGDHLINAKNCREVYDGFELENARYSAWVFTSKDISDCWGMGGSQYVYEAISPEEISNAKFVYITDSSNNVEYTDLCKASSNLFGCVGLQNKKYCILNQEYTKEEYEKLRAEIVEDMKKNPYIDSKGRVFSYGEFFPYDLSPFKYNETNAQEVFPLTKEEAEAQGFRFQEESSRDYKITVPASSVPANIRFVSDDFLNEVIGCSHGGNCTHQCTTAFKVTEAELSFYRANKIPLPTECPNCRHYARLAKRNPLKLWKRNCQNEGCTNEFMTTYDPERSEIIYCEACYNKVIL
jgi:hypothetical protein